MKKIRVVKGIFLIKNKDTFFLMTTKGVLKHPVALNNMVKGPHRFIVLLDLSELWKDYLMDPNIKPQVLTEKEKSFAQVALVQIKDDPQFYGLTKKEKVEAIAYLEKIRLAEEKLSLRWAEIEKKLIPTGISLSLFWEYPSGSSCNEIEGYVLRINNEGKLVKAYAGEIEKFLTRINNEENDCPTF